jgi:hypothetical protein
LVLWDILTKRHGSTDALSEEVDRQPEELPMTSRRTAEELNANDRATLTETNSETEKMANARGRR